MHDQRNIKKRKLSLTPFQFIKYRSSDSVFTKPDKRKLGVNSNGLCVI